MVGSDDGDAFGDEFVDRYFTPSLISTDFPSGREAWLMATANLLRPAVLVTAGLVVGVITGGWLVEGSMASHERHGYMRGAADGYNRGRDWAEEERDGKRIIGVAPDHIDDWSVPWGYPTP